MKKTALTFNALLQITAHSIARNEAIIIQAHLLSKHDTSRSFVINI